MKTDDLMHSAQNNNDSSEIIKNESLVTNQVTNEKSETENETDLADNNLKAESSADTILRKLKQNSEENQIEINSIEKDDSIEEIEEEEEDDDDDVEADIDNLDLSSLSMQELNSKLNDIIINGNIKKTKNIVEIIKTNFYKRHHAEIEKQRLAFIENDGKEEEFKPAENKFEDEFKQLYNIYKEKRTELNIIAEKEKEKNLEAKHEIIKRIEELINGQESLNDTFQEFKELQKQWQNIGVIPQSEIKNLWSAYNYQVEKFYDFVKINKDLRDLDFKKNLEHKIKLCEQAEELLLEPKVVTAFKILQKLHRIWREIGPVPSDKRDELWDRFKEATAKINKNHQDYFESLKKEQINNFKAKTLISEKVEELNALQINSHREWEVYSKEIVELQRLWKLIGFAPKKDNNKIYSRFRKACDIFFNNKREFYSKSREEEIENLKKKEELCIQAESMQDSTDWRKTSDLYINLQKKWKTLGPVPRKNKDEIWQRFRTACDVFFNNKSNHFSSQDESQIENLNLKKDLIEKVKSIKLSENKKENFLILNEIQKQWTEIGYVPLKEKDDVQKEFRSELNKVFEKLKLDESEKMELQFQNKIDNIKNSANSKFKARNERDKIVFKLDKLKSDIILWENNIGFFAKSKNADSMIKDFNKKINDAKDSVKNLENQLNMFDDIL
ncbi:MAG: DUF349 domain-containing protein [Bacteroidales bacterium]|nr:DUF349 domain-containing protein [Bacteroidales bacterium]MBN2758056.1 DUF349 domain-containing protein [Bacteroidales bacterium]